MAKVKITEENREKLLDLYAFAVQSKKKLPEELPAEIKEDVNHRMKHPEKSAFFKRGRKDNGNSNNGNGGNSNDNGNGNGGGPKK